jgi:glycosyltransferase involved in cell wall biosynthesis
MQKIVIVTDTWHPNVNGIVTSIVYTKKFLEAKGFEVKVVEPKDFWVVPMPTDKDIKFALPTTSEIEGVFLREKPNFIHLATEGPLGAAARRVCLNHNWPFTTSYHTQLPEYLRIRIKLHQAVTYNYVRWFHNPSRAVMVSTETLKQNLENKKFKNVVVVPLGVDVDLFKKNTEAKIPEGFAKPIFVFLGRVAPEKNIDKFLDCDLPGTKLIIGDGPARGTLQEKYGGTAKFVGNKKGQELIDLLSISDVFVFPSRTETFGLVAIEALACGLPVAGFVAQGTTSIVTNGVDGFLGEDLCGNAMKCLDLNPENCRKKAQEFSWEHSVDEFVRHLVPVI